MNKIFIALTMGFTILLGSCDEAPIDAQYIFDQKEHKINIKNIPISIILHENKIEWVEFGLETPIVNNMVELEIEKNNGQKFSVIRSSESLALGIKEDKLECSYPFKIQG